MAFIRSKAKEATQQLSSSDEKFVEKVDEGDKLAAKLREVIFNTPKKTLEELGRENEENLVTLRKHLGYSMAGIVVVWLLFVMVIIILQGNNQISLKSNVLITLLTTTTANVFILLRVIIKSLYPA